MPKAATSIIGRLLGQLSTARVLTAAAIAWVWFLAVPSMVPGVTSDRGIYIAVLERLLAGDRLYVDVIDNKDPLFYWLQLIPHSISPLLAVTLEVGYVLVCSFAVRGILRRLRIDSLVATIAAFALVPGILTGLCYIAGMTHLPGIAFLLVSVWAFVAKKPVVSGIFAGLLFFTKIVLFPFAPLVWLLLASNRRWMFPRYLLGLTSAGLVVGLTLLVRGELGGYLRMLRFNFVYSQGAFLPKDTLKFVGHFEFLAKLPAFVPILSVSALLALAIGWLWFNARKSASSAFKGWALLTLSSGIGAILVLGVSGFWLHHLQVLYIPLIVGLITLLIYGRDSLGTQKRDARWIAAILVVLSLSVSALNVDRLGGFDQSKAVAGYYLQSSTLANNEAKALLSVAASGSYARLGDNSSPAASIGVRSWRLACPTFQQYEFDTSATLNGALKCIETKRPVLLLAAFEDSPGRKPMHKFYVSVQRLIMSHYTCQRSLGLAVCVPRL